MAARHVFNVTVSALQLRHTWRWWTSLDLTACVQLTVAVHSVKRGVGAEVSKAVLTSVRLQVAGETLGGRVAAVAADLDSDEQMRSDSPAASVPSCGR